MLERMSDCYRSNCYIRGKESLIHRLCVEWILYIFVLYIFHLLNIEIEA